MIFCKPLDDSVEYIISTFCMAVEDHDGYLNLGVIAEHVVSYAMVGNFLVIHMQI
jgi:hypothetical protein